VKPWFGWVIVALAAGLAGCDGQVGTTAFAASGSASSSAASGSSASASLSASASVPTSPSAAPSASATAAPSAQELETVDDQPEPSEPEPAADSACAPPDPALKPVEVLRFTFADAVEGKDVKSKLTEAHAGQRVISHFVLRNRSGRERCVRLEFRVNGKLRTTLTQKVGKSWSWRTWGYVTLRKEDRGKLELRAVDDQQKELVKRELPIVGEK
jgi:hypothetical protein